MIFVGFKLIFLGEELIEVFAFLKLLKQKLLERIVNFSQGIQDIQL